eukprot:4025837-Amphidinium_carterae.1
MDSSPCVLSAGLLVAAGFGLTWTPEALELTLPNGCRTTLRSRGNVPTALTSCAYRLATRCHSTLMVEIVVDLLPCPVLYRLLYADDGVLLAGILFQFLLFEALEVPLPWRKLRGGTVVPWIGYELDLALPAVGVPISVDRIMGPITKSRPM